MILNSSERKKSLLFFDALSPAALLILLGSGAFVWAGRPSWVPGLWLAFAWIGANAFLLNRILLEAASGKFPDRRKIFLVLVVKFPVLYLLGFAVLVLGWVRLEAAAAAFTAYLAAAAFLAARPRILRKKER